jgi:ACS family glucarate transporter-like MFS transporter
MVSDLGLSDQQWGWVMASFAFGYALLQTPAGALADRFGGRRVLAAVVAFWSIFTGLTAGAWNFVSLLVVRFLFGAGEAGAFPGMARVVYKWIPVQERGIVKGINFSGSRLGAAATMPVLPWMIESLGWKQSFLVLMAVGFAFKAS